MNSGYDGFMFLAYTIAFYRPLGAPDYRTHFQFLNASCSFSWIRHVGL